VANDTEPFLSRWSRLKRAGGEAGRPSAPDSTSAAPATPDGAHAPMDAKDPDAPLPELPPIDQLTSDSDFRPFMDPRVPDALRRLALKKLYADPHFNVQDMLDDFAEDYTLLETLPAGMAGKLAHARRTLLGRDEADRIEAEEREASAQSAADASSPPPGDAPEPSRTAEARDPAAGHAQSRPSEEISEQAPERAPEEPRKHTE
jgi:hypothetical protein